jgi:autotransporter passenger strand-loop-strand repeat protein
MEQPMSASADASFEENTMSSTLLYTVASGTELDVNSGEVSWQDTVDGDEIVNTSGSAYFTTINNGGYQEISGGAYADYTTINFGGTQSIDSGGHADNTTVWDGGTQTNMGTANTTTVAYGGTQDDFGTANTTTVNGGGWQTVEGSGKAYNTTINGGTQIDLGLAQSTTIEGGGWQILVNGGTAKDTTVYNGSGQLIDSGWSLRTQVFAGGRERVIAGTASQTTVDGNLVVQGHLDVSSNGMSIDAILNYNGIENLQGKAVDTKINNGGVLDVNNGGIATATTINAGGVERVDQQSEAHGVTFNGIGGLLDLDTADSVSAPISGFGFGDQIDLRNVGYYGSNTTVGFSQGVLTVSNGVDSGQLWLMGQYSAGALQATSDGHGGTMITDLAIPPLAQVAAGTHA